METIDRYLNDIFEHKYLSIIFTMFLVFYSSRAAPKLPNFMLKLFDNAIFRILILSLIVYKGNKDPQFAIMVAVGFTISMNILSKQKLFEGFSDTSDDMDDDNNDDNQDHEHEHEHEHDEYGSHYHKHSHEHDEYDDHQHEENQFENDHESSFQDDFPQQNFMEEEEDEEEYGYEDVDGNSGNPVIDQMSNNMPDVPDGPKEGGDCKVEKNGTDDCGDDMICVGNKCRKHESLNYM